MPTVHAMEPTSTPLEEMMNKLLMKKLEESRSETRRQCLRDMEAMRSELEERIKQLEHKVHPALQRQPLGERTARDHEDEDNDPPLPHKRMPAPEKALQDRVELREVIGCALEEATGAIARRTAASLTVSPTNLHQVTVYYCLHAGAAPVSKKVAFLSASFLMVLVQIVVAEAIAFGILLPSCSMNSHCPTEHMFCGSSGVIQGRCEFCAYGIDGDVQNGTVIYRDDYHIQKLTDIHKDTFECAHDDQICQACYDETKRTFSRMGVDDVVISSLDAMRWCDWVAVFLTTFVLALSVAGEIRDIRLCWVSISAAKAEGGSSKGRCWVCLLRLLQLLRQYFFLQVLLRSVPIMVAYRGSDSLSVCFNTLAILFLLQVDNDFYSFALAEQTRAEVEKHGRVNLDTDAGRQELELLALTKNVHIALITVTVPIMMLTMRILWSAIYISGFVIVSLCGVAEAVGCNTKAGARVRNSAIAMGSSLLGLGGALCFQLLLAQTS